MDARRLFGALLFPAACLLAALGVHGWVRRDAGAAALASILAAVAASTIALALLGCSAIAVLAKLAANGWARLDVASRLSYRLAVGLFGVVFVASHGVLLPGMPAVAAARLGWIELGYFLIFWCSVLTLWRLAQLLRHDPGLPDAEPIRVWGRAGPLDAWVTLGAFLERVCAGAGCPVPKRVVLGLEPGVFCTRRPVHVGDQVQLDGTLYISLPLCRALSMSEFAALAAAEITRSYPMTPQWAEWYAAARHRAERILAREPEGLGKPLAAGAFCLLRSWRDLWIAFQVLLARYGARRAAVSAGRENTAAAIAKGVIYPAAWTPFLRELQAELRRGADAGRDNLSRRFAGRLFALPALDAFLEPFRSGRPGLLEQKAPELAGWLAWLEVSPDGIAEHLAAAPLEPAIGLIEGAELLEQQLSDELRGRVFFLRPAES